ALLGLVAPNEYPYEQELLAKMTAEFNNEAKHVWQQWSIRYLAALEPLSSEASIEQMRSNNPVYVLRNSEAQRAITAAEQGQFDELKRVFDLLANPYNVRDIATERSEERRGG